MPKFSVIIPIFNTEVYLRHCVDSVIAQTYKDFECILINDGSDDKCGKICDEYAEHDSRIKVVHQKNNGVSDARNKGLDNANGDWICFVDSDDWVQPNMLEVLAGNIKDNCLVQFCAYIHRDGVVEEIRALKKEEDIISSNVATVWRHAFPKSIVKNIRFDQNIIGGEDYVFCVKACLVAEDIVTINECLYNYNNDFHDSLTQRNNLRLIDDQIKSTKIVEDILSRYNGKYDSLLAERKKWCKIILLYYIFDLFKVNTEKRNAIQEFFRKIKNRLILAFIG